MGSELEVFHAGGSASVGGAGAPGDLTQAGIDVTAAHLADLRGRQDEWTLECFWLDAADPEGTLAAATAGRACAVVSLCTGCSESSEGLPPVGSEYMAHGARHVMAGDPALPLELLPDVCGLALALEQGESSWMGALVTAHGPGLYLVSPHMDEQGRMIGGDPVRVVV